MYHHLLNKIKIENPEWKKHIIKNTLLMVALILEEKTVNLWKLKSAVGKQLGTDRVNSRSHYQRIKPGPPVRLVLGKSITKRDVDCHT